MKEKLETLQHVASFCQTIFYFARNSFKQFDKTSVVEVMEVKK